MAENEQGFVERVGRWRWRGWIRNDEECGMAREFQCSAWTEAAVVSKLRAYVATKDARADVFPRPVKLRGNWSQ